MRRYSPRAAGRRQLVRCPPTRGALRAGRHRHGCSRSRDTRERGKSLRQSDDQRAARRRLRATFRRPVFRRPQQKTGDQESDAGGPQRLERALDEVFEKDPNQTRRNHRDDQQSRVAQGVGLTPQDTHDELPEAAPIHDQDGPERRDVQRDFHEHPGRVHAGHVPDDREMPVARNRQKLRESLHQSEQNALPDSHATFPATSAINPMTIAPLRSALTRSTLPSNNHAAATSTAIWARSAIRKYAAP